eukprot:TRINITY_DN101686_c0_g1_i1.p1 TRINITY_DN101686_c0_g1~~TRINITY_DN101686_c0_g1_i1.p1  ORF type:complete len:1072 (+),score=232.63 TRINITY_DN101686_c0_g1_i1:133-3348(+)
MTGQSFNDLHEQISALHVALALAHERALASLRGDILCDGAPSKKEPVQRGLPTPGWRGPSTVTSNGTDSTGPRHGLASSGDSKSPVTKKPMTWLPGVEDPQPKASLAGGTVVESQHVEHPCSPVSHRSIEEVHKAAEEIEHLDLLHVINEDKVRQGSKGRSASKTSRRSQEDEIQDVVQELKAEDVCRTDSMKTEAACDVDTTAERHHTRSPPQQQGQERTSMSSTSMSFSSEVFRSEGKLEPQKSLQDVDKFSENAPSIPSAVDAEMEERWHATAAKKRESKAECMKLPPRGSLRDRPEGTRGSTCSLGSMMSTYSRLGAKRSAISIAPMEQLDQLFSEIKDRAEGYKVRPIWKTIMEAAAAGRGGDARTASVRKTHIAEAAREAARATTYTQVSNRPHLLTKRSMTAAFETAGVDKLSQTLVAHPDGLRRAAWNLLGLLFVLFDIISVPLANFELAESTEQAFEDVAKVVLAYWSIDFFFQCSVGFYVRGSAELRLQKCIVHYAKTWMCLDVLLLTLDWGTFAVETYEKHVEQQLAANPGDGKGSESRVMRVLRVVRGFRALKMARVARAAKIPRAVKDMTLHLSRSESLSLYQGIIAQMICILVFGHVIACYWYKLGSNADGWVPIFIPDGCTTMYAYLMSMHWALTQFTPATMGVQPQNSSERSYAIGVLLLGLVTSSSFISSLTKMMNNLNDLKKDETQRFTILDRFLLDNNITYHLCLRIRRYLDHHLKMKRRSPREKDVEMLKILNDPLRMALRYEVYNCWLIKHPLFAEYAAVNMNGMQKLCDCAVELVHLSSDDTLFNQGDIANTMYFVTRGMLLYSWEEDPEKQDSEEDQAIKSQPRESTIDDSITCSSSEDGSEVIQLGGPAPRRGSKVDDTVPAARAPPQKKESVVKRREKPKASFLSVIGGRSTDRSSSVTDCTIGDVDPKSGKDLVRSGDWIAEMVLWTPWVYCGTLTADTESSLICLNAEAFIEVVSFRKLGRVQIADYANTITKKCCKIRNPKYRDNRRKRGDLVRISDLERHLDVKPVEVCWQIFETSVNLKQSVQNFFGRHGGSAESGISSWS